MEKWVKKRVDERREKRRIGEGRERKRGRGKQDQLKEEFGQSIGNIQSQKNRFAREQGKGVKVYGVV